MISYFVHICNIHRCSPLIGKPGGKSTCLNLIDILFRAHSDGDHGSTERKGTNADEERTDLLWTVLLFKIKNRMKYV